jgi:hypothetical protein
MKSAHSPIGRARRKSERWRSGKSLIRVSRSRYNRTTGIAQSGLRFCQWIAVTAADIPTQAVMNH